MNLSILERSRAFLKWAQGSQRQLATTAVIAADHVLGDGAQAEPFRPNEHYFQVRVNELFLAQSRQWFVTFEPMVLVVSEFIYDKKVEAVPCIVGPRMLEKYGQKLPAGMILADTRVAGLHPYKGGRLSISVVLSQVQGVNYARSLLGVVENAAGIGLGAALGSYLKVAEVVVDGLEALLGLEAIEPVMGYRKEFDPDGGQEVRPGSFALIDLPEGQIDPDSLWVRNGRLRIGPNPDEARPFRDADFVLYSIAQDPNRSDVEVLPFYPLWERVAEEAMKATKVDGDANWESAKSDMGSLYQTLMLSPDLTRAQAEDLTDTYMRRMDALRERGQKIAQMAPEELPEAERDVQRIRAQVGSILRK